LLNTAALFIVKNGLRCGLAHFKLRAHFLQARSKRFNLLLLARKLGLKSRRSYLANEYRLGRFYQKFSNFAELSRFLPPTLAVARRNAAARARVGALIAPRTGSRQLVETG
jgi:hypothetical protein